MKALSDTDILIDHLNGVEAAREDIGRHDKPMTGPFTGREVMLETGDVGRGAGRSYLPRSTRSTSMPGWPGSPSPFGHKRRLPDAIARAGAQSQYALPVGRTTERSSAGCARRTHPLFPAIGLHDPILTA